MARLAELANTLTHGIGLALSVAGLVVLVLMAVAKGHLIHIVSCSVYGSSLVVLYLASTLYHSMKTPRVKQVFRILDHSAIFVLIAGSYTPFLLVNMRGAWGWSLFGVVWGLALIGIVIKIFFIQRLPALSVLLYVAMGWLVIVAIKPLLASLPPAGILLLVAGGISYTGGLVFYAWQRLPYHHAYWHLAVMGGSLCHYLAVVFFVIPRGA